jgi:hypothetical protein
MDEGKRWEEELKVMKVVEIIEDKTRNLVNPVLLS